MAVQRQTVVVAGAGVAIRERGNAAKVTGEAGAKAVGCAGRTAERAGGAGRVKRRPALGPGGERGGADETGGAAGPLFAIQAWLARIIIPPIRELARAARRRGQMASLTRLFAKQTSGARDAVTAASFAGRRCDDALMRSPDDHF